MGLKHRILVATLVLLSSVGIIFAQNGTPPLPGFGTITAVASTCTPNVFNAGCVDQPLNAATSSSGYAIIGTWVGTILIERSANNGGSWATVATLTSNTTTSTDVAGYTNLRARASAWTSGTATVNFNPSTAEFGGGGSVTSIATTTPITGGTITATGTIACASCVTSASSLTSGLFMVGAALQAAATSSHLDYGITTASTLTTDVAFSALSLATTNDGVHAGLFSLPGNTTVPASYPSNSWGFIGPNSASFTSYFFQVSATAPAAAGPMLVAATASNRSAVTYGTMSGTGTVFCLATSCAMTTPALGAAMATSLLASGIVDGKAPITITTGASATLGAATYQAGYTFNQHGTAATAVTYTLPATATGAQYCVANSIVSGTGAPDTGVLTVYPPASSYVILNGVINTIGGGGTHGVASGGAAADAACFVAIDATHWTVYVQKGTWTAN